MKKDSMNAGSLHALRRDVKVAWLRHIVDLEAQLTELKQLERETDIARYRAGELQELDKRVAAMRVERPTVYVEDIIIDRLYEEAERFIASLTSQGLAPATNGRTLTILKGIFEKGSQWGYLTRNPARYIKNPQVPKKEMAFFNPEEMKRLVAATDERHRTLIMTACYTGVS